VFNYSAGTDLCKGTYYTKAVTIVRILGLMILGWIYILTCIRRSTFRSQSRATVSLRGST
jgi:hypothetical protein